MALEDITETNEKLLDFLRGGGNPNPWVDVLRKRGLPERKIRDALVDSIISHDLHYAGLQPSTATVKRGGQEVHEAHYLTQIVTALRGDGPVEYNSGYNDGTVAFPKLR